MKYVVLQHPSSLPVIVLGMMTTHDELIAGYRLRGYTPASAGFVRIANGRIETLGFSTSLNLTPNRGDAQLIAAAMEATLKTAPAVPSALQPFPNSHA